MRIPMTEHTKVIITWLDAHAASDGWMAASEMDKEPCRVTTLGYLIPDAKDGHVTVAQTVAPDGECYHLFCVPVGMVESVVIV